MNATQTKFFATSALYATRVGIVACLFQLANLWVPVVMTGTMQEPITFVKVESTGNAS